MNRKTIQRIIILAIVAIAGIIATQVYWIQTAMQLQEQEVYLQKQELKRQAKQDSLNQTEFNDRVHVALTNVAQQILTINDDPAELYKAVEQLRPNYFVVRINDTLHPYLLEQLLKREFDRSNVKDDYRYGIYDCFTDSIVYSNVVIQDEDINDATGSVNELPQIKWDMDGHYFSVTFPDKENVESEPYQATPPAFRSSTTVWLLIAIATFISLSFIGYALWVIIQQKKLSEIKTDFINNMTHELKTPISTISLSSEVLLRPDSIDNPERIERYAQIIYDENLRLQSQVERVLQLAKLDKGEIKLKKSEIDLHEVINRSVERFKVQAEQRGGSVDIKQEADNPKIIGDKVHITNIVYNLMDNANKYSRDKPKIIVRTKNVDGGIELCVRDNGIGMSKESLKQIFDKFYRVPTGNIHNVKGFGLGLFYVKELVKLHHGKISADSTVGEGSEFKIWFPIKK